VTGTPGFPASTVSVALQAELAFKVLPITLTPQRLVTPSSQPAR
jgi:broad-specificity NMP kinase